MIPFKQSFLLHLGHVPPNPWSWEEGYFAGCTHTHRLWNCLKRCISIYFFDLRREDVTSMKCKHVVTLQINQIVPGCWLMHLDAFRWFRRVGPSNIFLFRASTHDRALTNGQHAFFGTPQERSNNGSWPLGLQESINEKKQMGVVSGRSPTQGKCLKNEGLMLGCPSLQTVYTRNNYHSVEEHPKALCVHWIFRNLLVPAMDIQARNVWRSCKGHRVAWTWSFSPSPSTNLRYQISKID